MCVVLYCVCLLFFFLMVFTGWVEWIKSIIVVVYAIWFAC